MKRPALLALLILILATWVLAGCGQPATSAPVPTASLSSTQVPERIAATEAAAPQAIAATGRPTTAVPPTPTPTPTPTRTARPTSTPRPSPLPTATATPVPTLPPAVEPEEGEPLDFSLGWRLDANGHLAAAAIDLSGGRSRISLASFGRRVYALDGEDGGLRWQARTRGPVYALATLPGGRLAAGDDAGAVTVLDGAGQQLWRADLGSRVTALRATSGGELLAGGWDEQITLLDGEGRPRWGAAAGGPVTGIAALPVGQAELALAATLAGQVRAFDLEGNELWRFDAGSPLAGVGMVPTGGETLALLGAQDGRLLALDAAGRLRWQLALGSGAPVWHASGLLNGGQPAIVAGSGGPSPVLALLAAAEGQVQWRVSLPAAAGAITALDLDSDGQIEILAGLADGQVQAFDLGGRLRGTVHAGLPVWGLHPAGEGSALVLADVAAWQVTGRSGRAGGPWLPPPKMLPAPPDPVPAAAPGDETGGVLVFLGDVAFGRSMEAQLARYGPGYPWQGLGPLLAGAETPEDDPPVLAIANLECTLTTQGKPLDKGYLIRAHPTWARSLAAGGIDLVTLANNHALDFGTAGLEQTVEALGALGIETVGAGTSPEAARRPAVLDLGGVRVAFLGYAAARWDGSVDVPATDLLAWSRPGDIRADVEAARDQADVVVVLLHAGTEYAATPSADQVAAAHAAVEAGATLVVGHHPHVTQTVERYGQGLIIYSLGDAVFDIPRPAAMRGHLLRVRITADGLAGAELWPFWIDGAIQPRLLNDGDGNPIVEQIYP
ncbi:MAG: CapA family protein [Anaerolineae bacterium]